MSAQAVAESVFEALTSDACKEPLTPAELHALRSDAGLIVGDGPDEWTVEAHQHGETVKVYVLRGSEIHHVLWRTGRVIS